MESWRVKTDGPCGIRGRRKRRKWGHYGQKTWRARGPRCLGLRETQSTVDRILERTSRCNPFAAPGNRCSSFCPLSEIYREDQAKVPRSESEDEDVAPIRNYKYAEESKQIRHGWSRINYSRVKMQLGDGLFCTGCVGKAVWGAHGGVRLSRSRSWRISSKLWARAAPCFRSTLFLAYIDRRISLFFVCLDLWWTFTVGSISLLCRFYNLRTSFRHQLGANIHRPLKEWKWRFRWNEVL